MEFLAVLAAPREGLARPGVTKSPGVEQWL
jgi:hypothetical protein